jgi:rhodanese-related sulfurtransferase
MNFSQYKMFGFSLMTFVGVLLAFAPIEEQQQKLRERLKYSGEKFPQSHYLAPEIAAEWIIDKDPSIQIIDIRSQEQFQIFNIPSSINIPLQTLSAVNGMDFIYDDKKIIVIGQNSKQEKKAWELLKHAGFKNISLIEGGVENWIKVFDKPKLPAVYSTEEFHLHQFRISAGPLMMGKATSETGSIQSIKAPKPLKRKTRKAASNDEGC